MARRAWSGVGQGRQELFEQKRQVVLRTAARIFSQRGFHQTTLADVADELHVSKPALYHYFKSKDEILLEIQHAAIAQITEAAPDEGNGRERLTAFVRRYV
jgi:AcrR family transcriptional regulator